jgi:hypothetical protein
MADQHETRCQCCKKEFTMSRIEIPVSPYGCACSCKYNPRDWSWTLYQYTLGLESHVKINAHYEYIDNKLNFFCDSCAKGRKDAKQITHRSLYSDYEKKENIFHFVTRGLSMELQYLLYDESFGVSCEQLNLNITPEKILGKVLHPDDFNNKKARLASIGY